MKTPMTYQEMLHLQQVALGKEEADIILSGGKVLNVYTGEVLEDHTVLIAGERIAYVGAGTDFPSGPNTSVIDINGQVIIPGLIDGHCHMDYWMSLGEYAKWSLPRGTTTVVTEISAAANAGGVSGVRSFLGSFPNNPMRLYGTAPMIPFLCALRENTQPLTLPEMLDILDFPEILGLGEIYWTRLVDHDSVDSLSESINKARALGKTVEGHGAGAKNGRLQALVASGVDSCHEPISAEDIRERLRLGLATMIREGSIRRELETVIKPLSQMGLNLRRAILVTDGVWPNHLVKHGHMDYIVNKAIRLGLDPVTAVQMASLNVAEHFELDADLGGVAPGKFADLVVTPSLAEIDAQLVVCKGKLVGKQGRPLFELPQDQGNGYALGCNIPQVEPKFFGIPAKGLTGKVRVIEMITEIINRQAILDLPVVDGKLQAPEGVLKLAVLDRFEGTGKKSLGFIKGYGLQKGAVAISSGFDEGNTVVIGSNDRDMAAAVNRMRKLNGAMVFCCDGEIRVELPLPTFGTVSTLPALEVANRIDSLISTLREMGCSHENPLLTLLMATFTAIPALRLTVKGYWLSKENRYVELFA